MTDTWISDKTVLEISRDANLGDEARGMLDEGQSPRAYLDLLIEKSLLVDAVRFLAHALGKRHAVWWACQCARKSAEPAPDEPTRAALEAAERWAADPSEANRRAAQEASEAVGLGTPAGCAAMAAFWSGGSLAPPNVPAVPPADHLTGHGVAGSVQIAGVLREPEKAEDHYRDFLRIGVEIAEGANRWPEPAAPPEVRRSGPRSPPLRVPSRTRGPSRAPPRLPEPYRAIAGSESSWANPPLASPTCTSARWSLASSPTSAGRSCRQGPSPF